MPVNYGTNDIGDIYYGTNKIGEVWYGTNLVYTSNKIIDLGNGQTFDIKTNYPALYSNLTVNNFFFTTASSVGAIDQVTLAQDGQLAYLTLISGVDKSYNSSTGILTFYLKVSNSTSTTKGNVHAYLVTKPSQLVNLGAGHSFNVKNLYPSKYTQFTADNFLIKQIKHFNGGGSSSYVCHSSVNYAGTWRAADTCSITKSYNASTGVLTVAMNDTGYDPSTTWNKNSDCYVYLNTRV